MRRLLGPVGGPLTFFLIAALVFGGLGWVTVVALRVEQAQREAAAQAELGYNLRVAVRQLDTRVLSTLTVEDSRPFYHYNSADPLTGATAGPTPLLSAPLPDWLKLHVQLDSAAGWESPQVLSPDAAERAAEAWPELELRNNTIDRVQVYNTLKGKFPARSTWELLAARDRATPDDARPFAAPLFDPLPPARTVPPDSAPKPPPPPEMGPINVPGSPESFQLFGWDFPRRDAVASTDRNAEPPQLAQKPPKPPAFPPVAPPPGGAVGRENFPLTEKERQWLEYRNRAQTVQRATTDAKNASQELPNYGRGGPFQQNMILPGDNGRGGRFDSDVKDKASEPNGDRLKKAEQLRGTFVERLGELRADAGRKSNEIPLPWAKKFNAETHTVPPAEERPLPGLANTLAPDMRPVNIHLGSMRPQWITSPDGTESLVLVRAANIDGKTVYQGVVLDWPQLERLLKDEVKDLFPDAKLVAVKDPAGISPDRAMTALPVQLDPGVSTEPPPAGWTPLRFGLVLAWLAALVAFAAVGFSGWSLIDLAERRIRFVSAVTHELRTPLTSLRLYLDLLMSGMIQDEAKKQEYLNTLATESDRLHRLIDNVLDYAKLEKRSKTGALRPVKVCELIEQLRATWADRVAADGKELVVIATLAETEVVTDPGMVLQIVGNFIDNARKYTRDAEDKRIWLWVKPGSGGRVVFEIEDRGCGVPASERKSIFKPFRRGGSADAKAGGAGLGLALAKQWAEVLGGTVAYRPAEGAPGACFRLELPTK